MLWISDQVGTEFKKTYTSSDQFRRVTGIVGLKILCEKLRCDSRSSRHLGSEVLIIKFLVCPESRLKGLYKSLNSISDVIKSLRR